MFKRGKPKGARSLIGVAETEKASGEKRFENVSNHYELFFGRPAAAEWEVESKTDLDDAALLAEFVGSPEFLYSVSGRILSNQLFEDGRFDQPPSETLCRWAISRFGLTQASSDVIVKADTWDDLFGALFADPNFQAITAEVSTASTIAALGQHYFDIANDKIGLLASSSDFAPTAVHDFDARLTAQPKVVAFYLPQYHRVAENDEWWGEGFTEWTNVRKAQPNFIGHEQPHVPLGQNYYDLDDPSVLVKQTRLAKEYGISAFCYYMYWFDGRRVLEKPLDQMLASKDIDQEFCVCWANENWTRTWDGKAGDVLLGQVHTADSDRRFIRDAIKYLRDPRYMRVDGKLMLLVYRVDLLPDCVATAEIWREEVRKAGLGELHLCAVQFYGVTDPRPWGFDAAVEFPPHGWLVQENLPDPPVTITNKDFAGTILSYPKAVDWALSKKIPDYRWYRGVFPGWDNTARRQHTPHTFAHSDPMTFQKWITAALDQTVLMNPPEHQVLFVNAWNEWGEGAHLEPDERNGLMNLMALNAAINTAKASAWPLELLRRLRQPGSYEGREADELTLLEHLRGQERSARALLNELRRK